MSVHLSEETKTVITAALLIFAAAAWIWPLALGIHLEQEARKKRNEPPEYDERQRIARLRAGNFVSVMAGIVSYYVCAFLDRYRKDR